MTKDEYADYEARVARELDGLSHVSVGPCPGCPACLDMVECETPGDPPEDWFACVGLLRTRRASVAQFVSKGENE